MGKIYTPDAHDFPMSSDVVIIGGGIVGAAVAFFLARNGLSTIVIERRQSLGSLTTAASSECIRAQFVLAENLHMMQASLNILENFAQIIEIPGYEIGLHLPGYLYLTAAPDGLEKLTARVDYQRKQGLDNVEILTPSELRKTFPFVSQDATAATYRPGEGWCSVHEVTYGFAKGSNAQFLIETEALKILKEGSKIVGVQTKRGVVRTGTVVIAAGPFSRQIAKTIDIDLPLKVKREQEAVVHAHDAIPKNAPVTIDLDTAAFWRPEGSTGAMVSTGIPDPMEKPMDPVPTDWTFPAQAIEIAGRLSPFWFEVADSLTRDNVSVQAGQTTHTPDKKPAFGPYEGIDGLYLSVGYSGYGVMASSEAGRRLAALITGEESDSDNPFSPSRFSQGAQLDGEALYFFE